MAAPNTATNLPAKEMTIEGALKAIKEKNPDEAAFLDAVLKKNVITLGTDEAFALRDSEGEIKAFKTSITLSRQNGGLIQPVPNGPFVVSAQGYERKIKKHLCSNPVRKIRARAAISPMPEERVI